jgi:phage gp36-like protein
MAEYATSQDFMRAFGATEAIRITNIDSPTAAAVNETRMTEALADASDEIDSYLQERYTISVIRAATPKRLQRICLDIARYTLTKNRPPEDYRQRYEDAIRWLRDVAAGKASLGLTEDGEATPEAASALPTYFTNARIFTLDSMRSF